MISAGLDLNEWELDGLAYRLNTIVHRGIPAHGLI